jgi:protein-tyrosine phosphatase
MNYLSLNLVDSRQDDIMWFVCEVINFIEKGRIAGCKTLIHCEKGVSRSCSFVIAYIMWSRGT